jgi:hypothetical protein
MKKSMTFLGACAFVAVVTASVTGCYRADSSGSSNSDVSRGGSMARFAIVGDWMYTVNRSQITAVSIKDPALPVAGVPRNIDYETIETVFPMDTLLFVGSQSGMYIFDIKTQGPALPDRIASITHFKSCDPVVAYDTLAFVTLNASTGLWCGRGGNELQVYDIGHLADKDDDRIYTPVSTYTSLASPRGLAVDGDRKIVFVCDSSEGVKAFDFTNPRALRLKSDTFSALHERIGAYDCIVIEPGRLLVTGEDGIFQLGYDDGGFTRIISKIDLGEK